jgi:phospholipase C
MIRCGANALALSFAVAALAAGCGGGGGSPAPAPTVNPALHLPQHVVIVVMENRTVDDLFQFLPGADTAAAGPNSKGGTTSLSPVSLIEPYDLDHSHEVGFLTEYRNGARNGFDLEPAYCTSPKTHQPPYVCQQTAYGFVPQQEVQPYYQIAETYAFASHVLQTNQGPSYPAHEYLIAGQSGRPFAVAENPSPDITGGCGNTTPDESVQLIDLGLPFPSNENRTIFPCVDFPTIFDLLDQRGISWSYYTPRVQILWNALQQIRHLYRSAAVRRRTIVPETTIFNDIAHGNLSSVSYVVPNPDWSDHARDGCQNFPPGPQFVGALVNAIGQSAYWNDTAIIIAWDDWGGWYDHIPPVAPLHLPGDPYEYGFRVPLMVVSPYAKAHFIDGSFRDSTAILHFVEHVFGLPAIAANSLEQQTDDLFSLFQFGAAKPRPFQSIATTRSPAYWASLPSPVPSCIPAPPFPEPSGVQPALNAESLEH